jgi:AraC-like DNA-binding protein/rhodanese-related sulfurtransferase
MFETDCADVVLALKSGAQDFILLQVVGSRMDYLQQHVPGALHLRHQEMTSVRMAEWPRQTLFVVYSAGSHCNGAIQAALRLARLRRPVKVMIGGIAGWAGEGLPFVSGDAPGSLRGAENADSEIAILSRSADHNGYKNFDALHRWINDNLSSDLSISRLASEAGMSVRNFVRRYSEATGVSPARRIEQLRVQCARQALLSSRLPIKKIAEQCGFGSQETMRRSFLRYMNIPPQEYRLAHSQRGNDERRSDDVIFRRAILATK